MGEMKNSGIPWIGEIPIDWNIRPLKASYKLTTGFTPDSKNDYLYDEDGEIWVTISDLKDNEVFDSKQKISHTIATQHSKEIAKKGSLLYSFKLSVGIVAFAGKDLFTNEAIASILPKDEKGNLNYLKYASTLIEGNANRNIYNAKILNQKLILNAPLPNPSFIEQQAIADYLDHKCSKIDEIIAEAKASIEGYNVLKKSIIYELVSKGVNSNTEYKYTSVEWITKIPIKWKLPKLKYYTDISSGGTPDRNHAEYWNGEIDWIKTGELKNDIIFSSEEKITELGFNNSSAKLFPIDTILVAMYGQGKTRGMTAMLKKECATNQACAGIVIRDKSVINEEYLWFVLQGAYDALREKAVGTGQPNLSIGMLKDFYIPLPPLDEQREITKRIKDIIPKYDSLISEKQSLIADLEAYKKSLIYETVTGKRRVVL